MSTVNSLWYYSSAKPGSGYTSAVQGYGEKLASAMAMTPVALAQDDEDYLMEVAASDGPPSVILGAGEAVDWAAQGYQSPHILKARPYQDQHGEGPSMHGLTTQQLAAAKAVASYPSPMLLVCVANPMWLVEEGSLWANRIQHWARCHEMETLAITSSPRTNELVWSDWISQFDQTTIINHYHSDQNHYVPLLAHADAILILGSSRSMAGEAAMTGCPVYYVADTKEAQARFMSDTSVLMGEESSRFMPFGSDTPMVSERWSPFDVTDIYVQQMMKELEGRKAA